MKHFFRRLSILAISSVLFFACNSSENYEVIYEIFPPYSNYQVENEPFFQLNAGFDKALISAIKNGEIQAYGKDETNSLYPITPEEFQSMLMIPSGDNEFGGWASAQEYTRFGLGIVMDVQVKGNKIINEDLRHLKLFVTPDQTLSGLQNELVYLNFEDCAAFIKKNNLLWIDPLDQSRTISFDEAIKNKKFKAYSIEIIKKGALVYYNDLYNIELGDDDKEVKPLQQKELAAFFNDINSMTRRGFVNQVDAVPGKVNFKVTGTIVTDDPANQLLSREGKEIGRILLEAVEKGQLKAYANDSLNKQYSREEFEKLLYPPFYQDDEYPSSVKVMPVQYHISCYNMLSYTREISVGPQGIISESPKSVSLIINGFCIPTKIHKTLAYFDYAEVKNLFKSDARARVSADDLEDYSEFLEKNKFQIEKFRDGGKMVKSLEVYNIYGYKVFGDGFYFSNQDSMLYANVIKNIIKD
jgi:hypothetical protein